MGSTQPTSTGAPRVLIAGGGYVGLYTALTLERLLQPGEADVYVVNPENYMVYQPLLPEVASGTLEPRHAVVPLRKALKRSRLITGRLVGLDHDARTARIEPHAGEPYDLPYDHVVVALGSVTRTLPVPGLEERALGFHTLSESLHLRNRILGCMEAAEASRDASARKRALTFTFVGGGYTGVEALAELEDMARSACAVFPTISPDELRWVLVEATDRILPTVAPGLADHALRVLRARGIEVLLETTLDSAEEGRMVLSDGQEFDSDTLVWVAGVTPSPQVQQLGVPLDDQGRIIVDRGLRIEGLDGAWAAGDSAAVPDGRGSFYPPTAQHAQREGRHLGRNIAAVVRGGDPTTFEYDSPGEMITLGRNKGVAELYGRSLSGFLVWVLRRLYYVVQVPTLNRKARILLDWAVGLPFRREVVSLGSVEQPRAPLREAARQTGSGS